ncbi:hypothetical protein ACHWQZ_G002714 [Mnemiopsis leidyi]
MTHMTSTAIFLLIVACWFPPLSNALLLLFMLTRDDTTMRYQVGMHRCTLQWNNTSYKSAESHIFYTAPMTLLLLLYTVMLVHIIKNKTRWKKLLLTSVVVCSAGVCVAIPEVVKSTSVSWPYKTIQLVTVLPIYATPLCNSIIYYCSNPAIQRKFFSKDIWKVLAKIYAYIYQISISGGPMAIGMFGATNQVQVHCTVKRQGNTAGEVKYQLKHKVCEVRSPTRIYFRNTDVCDV